MQFTGVASLLFALFAGFSAAAPNLPRTNHGTIISPSAGALITGGASIPFSYQDGNWCQDGYSPISVWLLDVLPTTANMNSTGQFPDAYYFGAFVIGNFGLPPNGNPVPPATLPMPNLSAYRVGSEMYLAVVETANNCPPGNTPPQFGMSFTTLITG